MGDERLHFFVEVIRQFLKHHRVGLFVVDNSEPFFCLQFVDAGPIDRFGFRQQFHDFGDGDALPPDHDSVSFGEGVLFFVVRAVGAVLVDFIIVLVVEEDVGAHIVLGVIVDGFENGGVHDGEDLLRDDFIDVFVVLDFYSLGHSQPEKPPQVGVDQLLPDLGRSDVHQVPLQDLYLYRLL